MRIISPCVGIAIIAEITINYNFSNRNQHHQFDQLGG